MLYILLKEQKILIKGYSGPILFVNKDIVDAIKGGINTINTFIIILFPIFVGFFKIIVLYKWYDMSIVAIHDALRKNNYMKAIELQTYPNYIGTWVIKY